jgi:frataxin-like iron-binding protein CyaY
MLQNNGFAAVITVSTSVVITDQRAFQQLWVSARVRVTENSSYLSCWNVGRKILLKKRYRFSRSDA